MKSNSDSVKKKSYKNCRNKRPTEIQLSFHKRSPVIHTFNLQTLMLATLLSLVLQFTWALVSRFFSRTFYTVLYKCHLPTNISAAAGTPDFTSTSSPDRKPVHSKSQILWEKKVNALWGKCRKFTTIMSYIYEK